ncbi:MAG: hypothetical protein RLZZ58_1489 [Pseudomonadota bacterium]
MINPLSLSPSCLIESLEFGDEAQPMLVVDDCLADPHAVVAIAARHDYRPIGPFYPGVRAAVSERVAMQLVKPLLATMQNIFQLNAPPTFFECFLSIVTTPPQKLAPIQRLPHFDGVEPERVAVLLYLDRAERGGTAFYRQRGTAYESVTAERYDEYQINLDRAAARSGMPEARYICGDTAQFERVMAINGRFNRMVAYRGNVLHCADLHGDFIPDPNPLTGRLTLNLFLIAPPG